MSQQHPTKSIKPFPPHFDSPLSLLEADALAKSPAAVERHSFYPFLQYEKRWTRFAAKGTKGKGKCRLIRYAARRDAHIFAHYRSLLQKPYEELLIKAELSDSVIGYRRIKSKNGKGKCNIHFAKEAFDAIRSYGNCFVYALDISKFFENLDHAWLKKKWADLLGTPKLPPDHFKVFRAVTAYSWIDRTSCYEALGIIGVPQGTQSKKKFLVAREKIQSQLCKPHIFRDKIAPLIQVNSSNCGVPQGAPISDLLSNLYLFDFDRDLSAWSKQRGGTYLRYSDDILIILPTAKDEWDTIFKHLQCLIGGTGKNVVVNQEKCSAYKFSSTSAGQACELIHESGCKNGVEYLGLRYDGRHIFLRESTLAKLNRSITRNCRRAVRLHIRHNPALDKAQLVTTFSLNRLYAKVGRVLDFEIKKTPVNRWTFWTYIRRCEEVLGADSLKILRQVSRYKQRIRRQVANEFKIARVSSSSPD